MNFCIGIFFLLSSVALNATDYQERAHELNIQAYNGALEIICRYKAFMEDYLEFTENEIEQGKNDYHYNEQEIKFHIRRLEKEKNFIDTLNRSDKKFTCNMLQRFLRFRFDMLDYRLALFRRGELIEDRSERMYEKISCNTTICQFYDQLITDIYLLASQNPLSYEIHFLISISPSLWPLLTKASEELPNPDQGTYGKLNDRSSMGKNSDLYLFKTYYEKNKLFQLTVYGLGAPKNTTIATWMTPYGTLCKTGQRVLKSR